MQIIDGRTSVEEATLLIAAFGEEAVIEAATRADQFRDAGDLTLFCRWRQIERAVELLQLQDVIGELH
jgi:hypothetical protein